MDSAGENRMKLLRFWYQPQADVEFTRSEVEDMIMFSEKHYDYQCRELSKQGGVLYGMRNMFEGNALSETIVYRIDARTADLLAKTVESDPLNQLYKLMPIVKALNEEWRTVNKGNL
jgi:hypothetical protein